MALKRFLSAEGVIEPGAQFPKKPPGGIKSKRVLLASFRQNGDFYPKTFGFVFHGQRILKTTQGLTGRPRSVPSSQLAFKLHLRVLHSPPIESYSTVLYTYVSALMKPDDYIPPIYLLRCVLARFGHCNFVKRRAHRPKNV